MDLAPVPFSQNQISTLVLPLLSESKKLIWIHANELNLQLDVVADVVAELDKVFDRFPYLTQNQTAALAQRCSLHPDQVKVWFMQQRLHYGISWDHTDILKIRKNIKSSQTKETLPTVSGNNDSLESEGRESGRKKAREVREDQCVNDGGMMVENMRDNEKFKGKNSDQLMHEERNIKVETIEKYKINSQKKLKRVTVTNKVRKKRRENEGGMKQSKEVQITNDQVKRDFVVKTGMETMLEEVPHPPAAYRNGDIPDVSELEQLMEVPKKSVVGGRRNQIRYWKMTQGQKAIMKRAFCLFQYPVQEEYDRLSTLTGIARYAVVQWFSDMRYLIKKNKPRWMNQEQHSQALANIRNRQCLVTQSALSANKKATKKTKPDKTKSCGRHKCVETR